MKRLPFISTERALKVLGGRWKAIIVWHLGIDAARLSELERAIPGVSQKVLMQQLREMELHGLVCREASSSAHTRYSLTRLGESSLPLVEALSDWGRLHAAALDEPVASRCVNVRAGAESRT